MQIVKPRQKGWKEEGILLKSKGEYVTKLESFGRVEYKIRSAVVKVPAILISPRGQPAGSYLQSHAIEKNQLLLRLWSNGQSALAYAHKKKVFHLDVCPRNFIFSDKTNVFVLIDWGNSFCDEEQNSKPIGFRGSLPFAHAKVHARGNVESWTPDESYDNASLLFTVCALQEGSSNPFKGFHRKIEDGKTNQSKPTSDSPFKEREEKARASLNDLLSVGEDDRSLSEGATKELVLLYGHDISTIDNTKKDKIMVIVDRCLEDA